MIELGAFKAEVRAWLASQGVALPEGEDGPLLSSGRIDSVLLVDLLAWMEARYGVRVAWTALSMERVDSLGGLYGLVVGG